MEKNVKTALYTADARFERADDGYGIRLAVKKAVESPQAVLDAS